MKTLLVGITLMASLIPAAWAQTQSVSLFVHSSANIFGAGHASPPVPGGGGAGVWPSSVVFPANPYHVVIFTNVFGAVSLTSALGVQNGADGNNSFSTDITSYGGLSGIQSDASGFLVGVFLNFNEPTNPAPSALDFRASGLGTTFSSLSPQISQLFFIGDGLTGTGSGAIQKFIVPQTATGLYLGFADAVNYMGLPGDYGDNVGSLTAKFNIQIVPEPATSTLFSLGLLLLCGSRRTG